LKSACTPAKIRYADIANIRFVDLNVRLGRLLKQSWLICFLVFLTGWSTVSAHLLSHFGGSQPTQRASQHIGHAGCHEVSHAASQSAHHSCINGDNHQTVQQVHCQDCSSLHCNTLPVVLAAADNVPESLPNLSLPETSHSHYFARYLPGYWQEILRPPKA